MAARSRSAQVAIQQEREQLAQRLHDTVCQELTGICFMASALAAESAERDAAVREQFERIASHIQRTGMLLAELMRDLRTPGPR